MIYEFYVKRSKRGAILSKLWVCLLLDVRTGLGDFWAERKNEFGVEEFGVYSRLSIN